MKKVTWPNAKQVRIATLIVIATTIVSALILGLFDFIWSQVTELVYG
jgi:preprotein translocase subunit SecE